ncbi:CAP-Gly domain-containing linker protein 1-like [Leucoraja erinacea]|uniref:CAP-Gly domain-containing linker protein 1-like n=1 Tax=Leucoraja erinaceus TaxID=7782 RepID=UPI002454FE5A|nr:CAP-Gly domain-containing linker protein 1-like [Leucoraja erinacea]
MAVDIKAENDKLFIKRVSSDIGGRCSIPITYFQCDLLRGIGEKQTRDFILFSELETVKQRLKEKEDELKNRETDMGKHVQLDDEKLRELKAEHQTLQIIRQDLEKLLRARDKENEELRKDGGVEELKKKLSEVETALAAKEEELKIIKESTHGKEACGLEIKKLKDDLEEKQTSLNVKIKELEHIKEELEKTAQKLKRNDAEIAEHLRNDELRLKESKSELDKLEIIRKDVESLVKQKDEELERLRNIIKDREKSNAGRL